MTFNRITLELFTDDGHFLKKLNCPRKKELQDLTPLPRSPHFYCATCNHPVLDTAHYTDTELRATLAANPHTCLKVSANQPNLTLFPRHR